MNIRQSIHFIASMSIYIFFTAMLVGIYEHLANTKLPIIVVVINGAMFTLWYISKPEKE